MIERAATRSCNPAAFPFPRAWLEGTYTFVQRAEDRRAARARRLRGCRAASAGGRIGRRFPGCGDRRCTPRRCRPRGSYGVREIVIGGGVSANAALRQAFLRQDEFRFTFRRSNTAPITLLVVAAAGFARFRMGQVSSMDIDVLPT